MRTLKPRIITKNGFTIVELVVVIATIGILAAISIVGYGAWRDSITATKIKSDLNAAAAAMEDVRTFSNAYPNSLPDTIEVSEGVLLTGGSTDGVSYCIDGTSVTDNTIVYYVASETKDQGALEGTCATRPGLLVPIIPTNLAIVSSPGTQVNLSWTAVGGANPATSYTLQCASDAAFIVGLQESVISNGAATAGSVNNLALSTTFYCRIRAANNSGVSPWSSSVNTTTNDSYGSLAVATSLEGYWTSAPTGFLLEDGSAISRTTYADLFSVIGTTYGAGDGSTTFNLPDSRGRTSVNLSSTDTEFDTMGEKPGSKTEALTVAQMPSHTHTQNAHTHTQNAHTHIVNDPVHNHTQNGHSHSTASSSSPNGDYIGMPGGGQGGWALNQSSLNNIYRLIFTSIAATNNASTTSVSINSTTATNQSTTATNQNTGGGTHNNTQPSIVKTFAIKFSPVDAAATTLPEGSSVNGYWTSAPTGYLLEDGSAVSRSTYSSLFAVIGTTYGAGDGSTTFNLPDSRGRASVNRNPSDVEFDTIGETYGEKAHTLSTTEMPSHTHTQNSHTHTQNSHAHSVYDPGHNHTQNPHNHTTNNSTNGDTTGMAGGGQGGWAMGISPGNNNNIYRIIPSTTTATNNSAGTGLGIYNTTATNQSTTATNQNTGGGGSHNEIQPSIVRLSAIKATPVVTSGTNVASGTSISGYWTSAPTGYLLEDGSAVSRSTYSSLFAVIGTTYGAGDGSTTFNLPDSRGRTSVNKNSIDTEFDTIGEKYGTKTVTLLTAEMPSHTHTQNSHTHTQNSHAHSVYDPGHNHTQNFHNHESRNTPNGDYLGFAASSQGGWGIYADNPNNNNTYRLTLNNTTAANNTATTGFNINSTTATNQSTTTVNQNTGSNGAHNNIQPSIVKIFAIKI